MAVDGVALDGCLINGRGKPEKREEPVRGWILRRERGHVKHALFLLS